jgi:hypothetical protein
MLFWLGSVSRRAAMTEVPPDEVLRRHEAELRSVPGVTGVGLGEDHEGKEVIVVFVSQDVQDLDAMRARVPEVLDGYRTEVRPEIRVFPGPEEGEENSGH